MCHNVDDFISQDTVKYLGNQVQTVGESMKKFYSDVVQDLLPYSLGDPKKCEVEVSPNENNGTGNYIGSMISIEQNPENDHMKQSSDKQIVVDDLENSQMLSSEKQNSADALDNSQLSFAGHQISKQIAASVTDLIGQAQVDILVRLEDDALPCKNSNVSVKLNVELEEKQSPLEGSSDKEYKDCSKASLDCEAVDESHKHETLASASFYIDGAGLKSFEREGTSFKTLLECESEVPSIL